MPSPAAIEVTPAEWKAMFLAAVEGIPTGACMSADDVRQILPSAFPTTCLGGLFKSAEAAGLIAPTGHATSGAKSRRRGSQRVWVRV